MSTSWEATLPCQGFSSRVGPGHLRGPQNSGRGPALKAATAEGRPRLTAWRPQGTAEGLCLPVDVGREGMGRRWPGRMGSFLAWQDGQFPRWREGGAGLAKVTGGQECGPCPGRCPQ